MSNAIALINSFFFNYLMESSKLRFVEKNPAAEPTERGIVTESSFPAHKK